MTVIWIASVEGSTALVERLAQQGSGTPFYEEAAVNPFAAITTGSPYAVHHLCTALLLQERGFRKVVDFAGGQERGMSRRKKNAPAFRGSLSTPACFMQFPSLQKPDWS